MKFKKYTNFMFILLSFFMAFLLLDVFLNRYGSDYNVFTYYFVSYAIAIIFYLLCYFVHRFIILKSWKQVEGTIKKCNYSISNFCDLTYSLVLDKRYDVVYHLSNQEELEKQETLYVSKNNKKVYRERDILLSKKIIIILIIMAVILAGLGLFLNSVSNLYFVWENYDINELYQNLFIFRILDIFLLVAILIIRVILNKKKQECVVVEGKIIGAFIHEEQNNDIPVTTGQAKYEYYWNNKKREYVSSLGGTNIPRVGQIKKLFVNNDGKVIREEGELKFLIIFVIIWVIFYLCFLISVLATFFKW